LREIGEVIYLTADVGDDHGDPLLGDPNRDSFLSANCLFASGEVLKRYGLNLFLDLLKMDLSSSRSRFKSTSTDDAWHSKILQCLRNILSKGSNERKSQLKSLPMLPLWSSEWVSANSGRVYLPRLPG